MTENAVPDITGLILYRVRDKCVPQVCLDGAHHTSTDGWAIFVNGNLWGFLCAAHLEDPSHLRGTLERISKIHVRASLEVQELARFVQRAGSNIQLFDQADPEGAPDPALATGAPSNPGTHTH